MDTTLCAAVGVGRPLRRVFGQSIRGKKPGTPTACRGKFQEGITYLGGGKSRYHLDSESSRRCDDG